MPNVLAIVLLVMASLVQATPVALDFTLLAERVHPNLAFTQGLLVDGNTLVESSGGYRKSFVQRYPIAAGGEPASTRHLPRQDFAEGLAHTGEHLWLLTWQQGLAKQLSTDDLSVMRVARYRGEGWGLTWDGNHLIMSDGSNQLSFRDGDFAEVRRLAVTLAGKPLANLNELEYAGGVIWANVWFDNHLVAIHPTSGVVLARVDLTALVEKEAKLHTFGLPAEATLNGIAFDPANQTFWVTGKTWRKLYQIALPGAPALLHN